MDYITIPRPAENSFVECICRMYTMTGVKMSKVSHLSSHETKDKKHGEIYIIKRKMLNLFSRQNYCVIFWLFLFQSRDFPCKTFQTCRKVKTSILRNNNNEPEQSCKLLRHLGMRCPVGLRSSSRIWRATPALFVVSRIFAVTFAHFGFF